MSKENFISFDDFWGKAKNKQTTQVQTIEEIRNEFNGIKKIHQGKG